MEDNGPSGASIDVILEHLEKAAYPGDAAALILKLRKVFPKTPPSEINLAAEVYVGRKTAAERLGDWASKGYFTTHVLQQASREAIARHRSSFFQGCGHVLEIGTGSGSDTAALASQAAHVTTIELDPTVSGLAARNLAARGISNVTFLVGDAKEVVPNLNQDFDGLFADPARRTAAGERITSPDDYRPPLSFLTALAIGSIRCIKISPGLFVDFRDEGWIRQFVGVGDECLEQSLWYGSPIADSSACLADRDVTWTPNLEIDVPHTADTLEGYLIEAHATVNRTKALASYFAEHSIRAIAADVAYGIAEAPPVARPFHTVFHILESFPFNVKRIGEGLARFGWTRRTEFKKRGSNEDLDRIRDRLKLPLHSHGAPFGVVFLFPWNGKQWCILAERV